MKDYFKNTLWVIGWCLTMITLGIFIGIFTIGSPSDEKFPSGYTCEKIEEEICYKLNFNGEVVFNNTQNQQIIVWQKQSDFKFVGDYVVSVEFKNGTEIPRCTEQKTDNDLWNNGEGCWINATCSSCDGFGKPRC